MMRWRRIRPPGFPPFRRPRPLRPVHPKLIRANQLLAEGKFILAAELFEELGRQALDLEKVRAPHLFLQAGRARLLAGEKERGIDLTRQGLNLLEGQQRWEDLRRVGRRVVAGLRENGYAEEAEKIEQWLQEVLRSRGGLAAGVSQAVDTPKGRHPLLPTTCSSCGAPLYPQEINWVDTVTAVCNYCGNLVRGDEM